jgi:hypothetical protein
VQRCDAHLFLLLQPAGKHDSSSSSMFASCAIGSAERFDL